MPEQNIIVGPDGQIFRPREVPTGLASHVKFVVREYEEFNLELERMIENCRRTKKRVEESDPDAQDRADLLGIVLALGRKHGRRKFGDPGGTPTPGSVGGPVNVGSD